MPARKPVKTVKRHGPLASKGATAWRTNGTREVPTGHREVYISGVPFGTAHLVGMDGSVTRERTLCGSWPGKSVPGDANQPRCPVCFKGRE